MIALAGCKGGAPKGQVVATVDGKEITYSDLQAGTQNLVNHGVDPKTARHQALDMLIDQQLLLNAAKHDGFDREPSYAFAKSASEKAILASMYASQQVAQKTAVPTSADVDAYAAANPGASSKREKLLVDQIAFAVDSKSYSAQQFKDFNAINQIADHLRATAHPFQEQLRLIDTVSLPAPVFKDLSTAKGQEPVIFIRGTFAIAIAVLSHTPMPPSDPDADKAIKAILTQQQRDNGTRDLVASLRKTAKIQIAPADSTSK